MIYRVRFCRSIELPFDYLLDGVLKRSSDTVLLLDGDNEGSVLSRLAGTDPKVISNINSIRKYGSRNKRRISI